MNRMFRSATLGVFLMIWSLGFSQETERDSILFPKDTVEDYYVRFEGDSILLSSIELDEVYIFGKLEFADKNERLRYLILRRKTLKVYPYAKMAAERLVELNDSLQHITKKRHQKKIHQKGPEVHRGGVFGRT